MSIQNQEYLVQQSRQEVLVLLNSIKEGESVSKLLQDVKQERDQTEKKLKEEVNEYFQNMKVCETLTEKCQSNLKLIQTNFKDFDRSVQKFKWAQSPSLQKLVQLRKNTSQVVDTLHDFLNVSSQMKNLKEQMKDYRTYEHVQRKLLTICNLRDSMMNKASTSKKLEQTFKNFSEKFKEIKVLEDEFNRIIFDNIADSIDLAKHEPKKLAKTLKVVEIGDLADPEKGLYFKRAQQALRTMVHNRFEDRLGEDANDIGSKLEAAKNSVDDMMDVHQLLVPVFPPKFDIFNFIKSENKKLVEDLVLPYLNQDKLQEDPGVIVYFISWLDNYEILLNRVGIEGSTEYADLRQVDLLK